MMHLGIALALLAGWGPHHPAEATAAAPTASPDAVCIRAWKEAPYRNYGYDHIVAIHNGCPRAVQCTVTTSVNAHPAPATVAAGRTARVLTFRGAPTRDFRATIRCSPQP